MPVDPWPDESDEVDPWPDEPDEVDPEARWGNPERDLLKGPRIPEAPKPRIPEATVGSETSRVFWASVIFVNFAVFALSLGPMLIVFRGQWLLGSGLVGGGLLVLARTYYMYQQYKQQPDDDSSEPAPPSDADTDSANGRVEGDTDSSERKP